MAILPITAELLAGFVFDQNLSGHCAQLGRQSIHLTADDVRALLDRLEARRPSRRTACRAARTRLDAHGAAGGALLTDAIFFDALGFAQSTSVDASDFEGADVIHDLNVPGLSAKLGSPPDLLIETGTAEHVFHLPHYLGNVCDSLKVGGCAFHCVPAHGYVDHGFYQFSPTVFYDFYRANGFEILDLVVAQTSSDDWAHGTLTRYEPGSLDGCDRRRFANQYVSLFVAVRKLQASTSHRVPQQRQYVDRPDWLAGDADVLGQTTPCGALTGPFVQDAGRCWRAPAPAAFGRPDSAGAPRGSRLILYEDGRPLGPAHALHADVRRDGGGRFSHWGDHVWFSTSDATNPNSNGRTYTARLRAAAIGCALDLGAADFDPVELSALLGWRHAAARTD